jgi:hypothetical protein
MAVGSLRPNSRVSWSGSPPVAWASARSRSTRSCWAVRPSRWQAAWTKLREVGWRPPAVDRLSSRCGLALVGQRARRYSSQAPSWARVSASRRRGTPPKEPITVAQRELGLIVGIINPHPPQRRAERCSQRSSSRSESPPSGRASSLKGSPTPTERSTDRRAGRPEGMLKRRGPPERASHPATEAAGGWSHCIDKVRRCQPRPRGW